MAFFLSSSILRLGNCLCTFPDDFAGMQVMESEAQSELPIVTIRKIHHVADDEEIRRAMLFQSVHQLAVFKRAVAAGDNALGNIGYKSIVLRLEKRRIDQRYSQRLGSRQQQVLNIGARRFPACHIDKSGNYR